MAVILSGVVCACGKTETEESSEIPSQSAAATESPEEAKALKVLTLGHSLAVDSGHLLNLICAAEGTGEYEEVVIGTLYYAGCTMQQHVNFMKEDSKEYWLYVSSSKTPDEPPKVMKDVDMLLALEYDCWDIIVMQDGVFEIAEAASYTNGNVQILQDYVNKNKTNVSVRFAWHMTWVPPTDHTLLDTYPHEPNPYYSNYENYNNDRSTMYNEVVKCVKEYVATDETFEFIIPSATAFENALSSYMKETDIHRDWVHATDFARMITSYVWYCKLMGIEKLNELKVSSVPRAMLNTITGVDEWVLTDLEKDLILESVNNALEHPFEVTQSQYTQAP